MLSLTERWQGLQRAAVLRYGSSLLKDIDRRELDLQTRSHLKWTPGLMLAFVLAGVVWSVNIFLAVGGVAMLWFASDSWLFGLLGLSLLALAWLAKPQRNRAPDRLLDRQDFPMLHQACDRIAGAIQSPPLAGIGVSIEFNANYRSVGWRSRRYIEIGAALLGTMDTDEVIAVLAHELSHGANRDPMRGQLLYGAVHTLVGWSHMIRPLAIGQTMPGVPFAPIAAIIAIPLELLQLAISELLLLCAKALFLLVARQSQRAEYLADLIASHACGLTPLVSLLEKLCLYEHVEAIIHQHALTSPDAPLLPHIKQAVRELPAADRQAAMATAQANETQVDASHPPTVLRMDVLRRLGESQARVQWSQHEAESLQREIEKLFNLMQRDLIDRELVKIYG
jgi:Zn-dependent protease with chaperone function